MSIIENMTIVGEGLIGLTDSEFGNQLWARCRMRKAHICQILKRTIRKGEQAYRPVTNKGNRMRRISESGMRSLAGRFVDESGSDNE